MFSKYGKNSKSYYDQKKGKVIYFDAGNGWSNGESCEPFVGALIIYSFSHIAIIVGQTADGQYYVTLGGNQGGEKNNREICFRTFSKKSSQIIGITKPKNYTPNQKEKELPVININETEQLTYENTH